jgi:hypothetical protein
LVRNLSTAQRSFIIVILTPIAILFGIIIANLDKGYDVTDEGYYLLSIRNSTKLINGVAFPLFLKFFNWFDNEVLVIRIARIALYIILSSILLRAVSSLSREENSTGSRNWLYQAVSISAICSSIFASYSSQPNAIGYNELDTWFAYLWLASAILLHLKFESPILNPIFTTLVFFFSFNLFLVKFPTGIIFFAGTLMLLLYLRNWKNIFLGLFASLVLDVLLSESIHLPIRRYIKESISFALNSKVQTSKHHVASQILTSDIQQIAHSCHSHAISIALIFFYIFLTRLKIEKKWTDYLFLLYFIFNILIFLNSRIEFRQRFSDLVFFNVPFIAICLAINSRVLTNFEQIFSFILFVFPFLISLGTDNPILWQCTYTCAPWFILLLMSIKGERIINSLVVLFSVLLISCLSIYNFMSNPYRQAPLSADTYTASVQPLKGLQVDKQTYWVTEFLSKKPYQTLVIGAPGFEVYSPSGDGYWIDYFTSVQSAEYQYYCDLAKARKLRILIPKELDGFPQNLLVCFTNLNRDYNLVNEASSFPFLVYQPISNSSSGGQPQ